MVNIIATVSSAIEAVFLSVRIMSLPTRKDWHIGTISRFILPSGVPSAHEGDGSVLLLRHYPHYLLKLIEFPRYS
jgi:hypothetical protein